ncbi:hypothetical protein ACFQ4C_29390 [Larkinella insperata]|uniref:Uncharacterized protein n=1 Tax=Larkinella insperata TaxID=332158 RepID=A0ABW3QGW8_9BACT|nr:hypothetical protein [Larkinella insperata]
MDPFCAFYLRSGTASGNLIPIVTPNRLRVRILQTTVIPAGDPVGLNDD